MGWDKIPTIEKVNVINVEQLPDEFLIREIDNINRVIFL